MIYFFFFFSSRRRHTRLTCDWSSDVCSSDLGDIHGPQPTGPQLRNDPVPIAKPLADVGALADIAAHAAGSSAEPVPASLRRLNRESSVAARRRGGHRSRNRSTRRSPCTEWTRVCPCPPESS